MLTLLPILPADDVVGDDESSWHDRVSSGFDRLVAFASTELDKTRRSNEDAPASSASCTTSPDSGINQSDHSRTFLSSSSSSSQLDVPPSSSSAGSTASSSSSNGSSVGSGSMISSLAGSVVGGGVGTGPGIGGTGSLMMKHMVVPLIKSSPAEPVDSPPLSDVGLPRTPSPSSSPPLLFAHTAATVGAGSTVVQPSLLHPGNGGNSGANIVTHSSSSSSNSLGIPLKYQRQSKSSSSTSSTKHYKKKFRERNWEEYEESLSGGRNSAISGGDVAMDHTDFVDSRSVVNSSPHNLSAEIGGPVHAATSASASVASTETTVSNNDHHHHSQQQQQQQQPQSSQSHHHKHKSAKFRPKGKDWNWDDEHSNASSSSTTSTTRGSGGGGARSGNPTTAT